MGSTNSGHKSLEALRFSQSNEKAQMCEKSAIATHLDIMSSCGRVWFLEEEVRANPGESLFWDGPERQNIVDSRAEKTEQCAGPTNSLQGS